MDLNQLLLILVVMSCGLTIAMELRHGRRARRGWPLVAAGVLAAMGLTYLWRKEIAGYVGGGLWGAFIVLPGLLQRLVTRAVLRQNYRAAAWLATLAGWLHPMDEWLDRPILCRALEQAELGDTAVSGPTAGAATGTAAAVQLLEKLRKPTASPRRREWARLMEFYVRRDWAGFVDAVRQNAGETPVDSDLTLMAIYLRALGEIGDLTAMLGNYDRFQYTLRQPAAQIARYQARMYVFAFLGRPDMVRRITSGPLSTLARPIQEFWIATAGLVSGEEGAAQRLRDMLPDSSGRLRVSIEERLSRGMAIPELLLHDRAYESIAAIESAMHEEERYVTGRRDRRPWVTWALVVLNVIYFVIESYDGASTDEVTMEKVLTKLGAVETGLVLNGQWWRLIAANFLHAGVAHISMNMFALLILGPYVERTLGKVLYLVTYLFSGIVALLGVVILMHQNLIPNDSLVGASGAIMGLIGATAAVMLRGRLKHRSTIAGRRLQLLIAIIVLQATFDHMIPQISGSAHLIGCFAGFAMASLLPHHVPPLITSGFPVIPGSEKPMERGVGSL